MNSADSYIRTAWRETSPGWLLAVAAMLGEAAPDAGGQLSICDLGCGPGFATALTAAVMPRAMVTGFDADPAHVAEARQLAAQAGLDNLRFECRDIAELAAPPPRQYDLIVVHGVMSWVAEPVRQAIIAFIGKALADGGLAYLHYACQPGASTFAALNAALRAAAPDGPPARRLALGLPMLKALRQGAGLFAAHPQAGHSFDALLQEAPAYIRHELAGDHFRALSSGDVIGAMAAHGLRHAGSATAIENVDRLSLPAACLETIQQVADPALREVLKDIARDQALRRDIFVRGAPLAAPAHLAALRALRFRLSPDAPPPGAIGLATRIGPVEGAASVFAPLIEALRQGTRGFAELEAIPPFAGRPGLLNQSLAMLMEAGAARPVWPVRDGEPASRFNRVVSAAMQGGAAVPALADAALLGPGQA